MVKKRVWLMVKACTGKWNCTRNRPHRILTTMIKHSIHRIFDCAAFVVFVFFLERKQLKFQIINTTLMLNLNCPS